MRSPRIPPVTVELGRAVELDSDNWQWNWNKKHDWVVSTNPNGSRLYLFKKPKKLSPRDLRLTKADHLYKVFNRSDYDKALVGNVSEPKKKVGRAIHVVYESCKFGPLRHYIHTFDNPPIVWADKPEDPSVIALTGGKIKVTKRGIEG